MQKLRAVRPLKTTGPIFLAWRGRCRMVLVTVGFELGLGALALLLAWIFGSHLGPLPRTLADPANGWRHDLPAIGMGLLATVPLLGMLWVIDHARAASLVQLRQSVRHTLLPMFRGTTWWQLAAVAAAAGIGEELLFRGWMQYGLQRFSEPWAGAWPAVFLSAIVFGVCHWLSTTYAVLATVVGVYLGAVLVLSDNLLAPITAHATYDFLALLYVLHVIDARPTVEDDQE